MKVRKKESPMTIRLKKGNKEALERIMDAEKLNNPNQTINYIIENWDEIIRWRHPVNCLIGFVNSLKFERLDG